MELSETQYVCLGLIKWAHNKVPTQEHHFMLL